MKSVWKFVIDDISDEVTLQMPKGARVLTVQTQGGAEAFGYFGQQLCLWAEVDTDAEKEPRRFRIAGTGHRLPDEPLTYLGTFQLRGGALVFHVYEVP